MNTSDSNLPDLGPPSGAPGSTATIDAGRVLYYGFATAVATWVAWFATHHPAVAAPAVVTGPLLLALVAAGAFMGGRGLRARNGAIAGALVGGLAGVLDLLVVLSIVVSPPTDGRPAPGIEGMDAQRALASAGFALSCAAIGAIAGLAAGARGRPLPPRDWLARFAVVAVAAIVPLLLTGGGVTSSDAGMSVRGWPHSDGALMVLYPISLMSDPRVFLEHTHRLFGVLVGVTTACLVAYVAIVERRRRRARVIGLAVAILALVGAQGIAGGLRVTENDPRLGLVHGITGQVILALAVVLAAMLSAGWRDAQPVPDAPRGRTARRASVILLAALLVQLALGAAYRHLGHAHVIYTHAAFALVVVVVATIAGAAGSASAPDRRSPLRRVGMGLIHATGAQVLLGVVALILVLRATGRGQPPGPESLGSTPLVPALEAAVTTAHQGLGAAVVALAALLAAWTRRLIPPR